MNIYLEAFGLFSKIGVFTIGGGYAMVPLIEEEIVDKHGTCSNWNSNYKKFYSSKKQAVKVLRELLLEIAAIRQVLQSEEEQDEDYKK